MQLGYCKQFSLSFFLSLTFYLYVEISHSFSIFYVYEFQGPNSYWMYLFVFVAIRPFLHTYKSTHPYIYFRSIILLALKEFRCSVRRTATPCLQQLSSREHVTEAKIWQGDERCFSLIIFLYRVNSVNPEKGFKGTYWKHWPKVQFQ